MYKPKSNTSYIETLNTLDDIGPNLQRKCKVNKTYGSVTGKTGTNIYGRTEEINQTQQPLWLVNNILFCYEGETHMENDSERKQHFLQHKEKNSNNKKSYTDGSKSTGRKVDFASVFTDITRRGILTEEASIHTA